MAAQTSCSLTLYNMDTRISNDEWADSKSCSITQQNVDKVNQMVAEYFQVNSKMDQELLASVFTASSEIDSHEFTLQEKLTIFHGIQIAGNRDIVHIAHPKPIFLKEKENRCIQVTRTSAPGNKSEHLWTYEDLSERKSTDQTLFAFYNSEFYSKYIQMSFNLHSVSIYEIKPHQPSV